MEKQVQKLLGPWTLQGALQQRVDREAEARWALRVEPRFKPIPPLVEEKQWSVVALWAFARGCVA